MPLRGIYPLYALASRTRGATPLELRERLGLFAAPLPPQGALWIQASSVGEVAVAAGLIEALRRGASLTARPAGGPAGQGGAIPAIHLTATTRTGRAQAQRLEGNSVSTGYCPLDFRGAVRRFLDTLRPGALLLVETELWPNLLAEAEARGIPVLIANGRISDRALRRYRFVKSLMARTLSAVRLACVQTPRDGERFEFLGLAANRVRVAGNLKFALASDAKDPAPLLAELGLSAGDELWLAGSTADGEEEAVLAAWRALPPSTRARRALVIAPRRPERFEAVARLIAGEGRPWARRSAGKPDTAPELVLLDTIGELSPLYSAASVAFVGGTLVPIGGHNILEPASRGIAPVFGPHVANIREVAARLLEAGGAFQAADGAALSGTFARLAADPALRLESGSRARKVVEENAHALETTVREVLAHLPRPGAPSGSARSGQPSARRAGAGPRDAEEEA